MPKARPLSKNEITAAMNKTKSVRAASRYLNCSYQHLKKWMLFYDGEGGGTLFDQHKNQSGKGIPKFLSHTPFGRKEPAILDIIEGRADPSDRQIEIIEDHLPSKEKEVNWEVDEYTRQRLTELGLYENKPVDDGSELISRI